MVGLFFKWLVKEFDRLGMEMIGWGDVWNVGFGSFEWLEWRVEFMRVECDVVFVWWWGKMRGYREWVEVWWMGWVRCELVG